MIREHRWTLVLVAVMLGCGTSTPGHPTSPEVGSRTGPGLVTSPAAATGLYVAGEHGMHELDAAGNRARRLTRTPAFRPRLVEGGRAITYLSPGPSGTEIRRLELASLADTTLATLPRDLGAACGMGDDYQAVEHVQDDSSFVVSADGSAACLTVQDRNDNLVSVQLMVRVDLATGKLEQVVTMADRCESVEAPPHFMCAGPPVAAGYDTRGDTFPYRVRDGQLMQRDPGGGESARGQLGDLEAELSSESGRWQLLAGSSDSGDYIYRKLVLLDRRSGALYPVRAGAWPAAVQPAELARLVAAEDGTVTVVGEDPVRALAGDRLLAGRLLVIPESKIVNIEGELAR